MMQNFPLAVRGNMMEVKIVLTDWVYFKFSKFQKLYIYLETEMIKTAKETILSIFPSVRYI